MNETLDPAIGITWCFDFGFGSGLLNAFMCPEPFGRAHLVDILEGATGKVLEREYLRSLALAAFSSLAGSRPNYSRQTRMFAVF
jgi:hypothetical protein